MQCKPGHSIGWMLNTALPLHRECNLTEHRSFHTTDITWKLWLRWFCCVHIKRSLSEVTKNLVMLLTGEILLKFLPLLLLMIPLSRRDYKIDHGMQFTHLLKYKTLFYTSWVRWSGRRYAQKWKMLVSTPFLQTRPRTVGVEFEREARGSGSLKMLPTLGCGRASSAGGWRFFDLLRVNMSQWSGTRSRYTLSRLTAVDYSNKLNISTWGVSSSGDEWKWNY